MVHDMSNLSNLSLIVSYVCFASIKFIRGCLQLCESNGVENRGRYINDQVSVRRPIQRESAIDTEALSPTATVVGEGREKVRSNRNYAVG